MMQTLKYKFYSLFSSKVFLYFVLFFAILFLTGCEETGETADGKEGNIAAQITCWQTAITNAVLGNLNDMYKETAKKVSSGGSTIILLAFAVWLALKLLKVLGSFKEENVGEVWTEIFQKLVLCAVCAFIVHKPENISTAVNSFVVPIYNAVIELASQVLNLSADDGGFNLGIFGQVIFGGGNPMLAQHRQFQR